LHFGGHFYVVISIPEVPSCVVLLKLSRHSFSISGERQRGRVQVYRADVTFMVMAEPEKLWAVLSIYPGRNRNWELFQASPRRFPRLSGEKPKHKTEPNRTEQDNSVDRSEGDDRPDDELLKIFLFDGKPPLRRSAVLVSNANLASVHRRVTLAASEIAASGRLFQFFR
jgi:hypothetical protein